MIMIPERVYDTRHLSLSYFRISLRMVQVGSRWPELNIVTCESPENQIRQATCVMTREWEHKREVN